MHCLLQYVFIYICIYIYCSFKGKPISVVCFWFLCLVSGRSNGQRTKLQTQEFLKISFFSLKKVMYFLFWQKGWNMIENSKCMNFFYMYINYNIYMISYWVFSEAVLGLVWKICSWRIKMQPECVLWLVVALVSLVRHSAGYSNGAPIDACSDLTPQHGAAAQTAASPYSITFSPATFTAGGTPITGL